MSFPGPSGPRGMNFTGDIWLPGHPEYDKQRRPVNPALDPRPVMVVESCGTADVQAAMRLAREEGLPFAVQSTGHGTHVAADGALLLRTSRMANVLVDPDRR